MKVTEKEYDGKKYFNCLGIAKDKEIYKFSANYDDHPKEGDVYQMTLTSSDRDLKPYIRFNKVK
jgi:hypothetical protein